MDDAVVNPKVVDRLASFLCSTQRVSEETVAVCPDFQCNNFFASLREHGFRGSFVSLASGAQRLRQRRAYHKKHQRQLQHITFQDADIRRDFREQVFHWVDSRVPVFYHFSTTEIGRAHV